MGGNNSVNKDKQGGSKTAMLPAELIFFLLPPSSSSFLPLSESNMQESRRRLIDRRNMTFPSQLLSFPSLAEAATAKVWDEKK